MEFYVYLGLLTFVFMALTAAVWHRTRNIAFMVGAFFLYYWSLFGAWNIVASLRTGEDTPYLFYKVYPVNLDGDYVFALGLYALFICGIMATVLFFAHPAPKMPVRSVIEMSHWKAVTLAAFCGMFGYLLIRSTVGAAADSSVSIYATARTAPGYSLFQVLNHAATSLTALGLATYLSGERGRFVIGRRNHLALLGYIVVLGGLVSVMMRMGNRGEAALTFALLLLFYIANTVQVNRWLLAGIAGAGAMVVMSVKMLRDNFGASSAVNALDILLRVKDETVNSTESIAAHLSMYGVLHKQVAFTWGSSFASLAGSMVPRALFPNRPPDIYPYYVAGVGAMEGQGYTIHHATGWYLNFGIAGVLAAAFLIGLCWAKLSNLAYDGTRSRSNVWQAFAVTAFWTFTSGLPDLLRAGPEVYKTTFFSQLLGPALMLTLCSTAVVLHLNRPTLVFRRRIVQLANAVAGSIR